MDFNVEIPPIEDINPARTKHIILKRPKASWSQSVFSVPFGDSSEKIVPNRDYPYEGLSVLIEGENFHFLDGIAVGAKKGSKYIKLRAKKVIASPWEMIYHYNNEEEGIRLAITYYLMDTGALRNGVTACVSLETNASSIVIEPVVDIRHMYDESAPDSHFCKALNDGMLIWRAEKCISLRTVNKCEIRTWGKKKIEWWYKLGSGFRENIDGKIVFKGEIRNPVSLGELEIPMGENNKDNTALLVIAIATATACSHTNTNSNTNTETQLELEWLTEKGKEWLRDESEEEKRAIEMVKSLGLSLSAPAIAFRALALSRFGMYLDKKFFYEAGDFWFRTPWFRDLFEGIINNIETLFRIGHAERIRDIILRAFEYQDKYGRIPNRFPKRKGEGEGEHEHLDYDYNSADATLLAFIAAGEFLKRRKDENFASTILRRAEFTISRFKMNSLEKINGAPVLNENGLISIVPWHSWTDTKREVEIGGKKFNFSTRIPDSWCDACNEDELNKPKYFLPEINAQWIKMLRACVNMCLSLSLSSSNPENETGGSEYSALLEKARENFKKVLWNAEENILYNLVTVNGKKDNTPGSPGVVAFSLLLDENIFSQYELKGFIKEVKENLLVEKNGLPFGILVKKSPRRTYYGDAEYHEAVVWPRDTPYLIRILRAAGELEEETVEGILRSNLEHQMNEGFVFYNSELFSPDKGEMVPVKNPVQFWSQWVDAYIT